MWGTTRASLNARPRAPDRSRTQPEPDRVFPSTFRPKPEPIRSGPNTNRALFGTMTVTLTGSKRTSNISVHILGVPGDFRSDQMYFNFWSETLLVCSETFVKGSEPFRVRLGVLDNARLAFGASLMGSGFVRKVFGSSRLGSGIVRESSTPDEDLIWTRFPCLSALRN